MPIETQKFDVGTSVRVTGGQLAGVTGVVVDASNLGRIVIRVDFCAREIKVVLRENCLDVLSQAN